MNVGQFLKDVIDADGKVLDTAACDFMEKISKPELEDFCQELRDLLQMKAELTATN